MPASSTTLLTPWLRRAGACIGWFAVLVQLACTLHACLQQSMSVQTAVVLYLSFFTNLTNILAATAQTALWLAPRSRAGRFFQHTRVQTGIAIYLILVGSVYELLLRNLWTPTGWQLLADTLLHDVAPVLYLLYWFVGVHKDGLRWSDLLRWLAYPTAYVTAIMLRGAAWGVYPYGFLDADSIGYASAFAMIAILAAVICVLGVLAIIISKALVREPATD